MGRAAVTQSLRRVATGLSPPPPLLGGRDGSPDALGPVQFTCFGSLVHILRRDMIKLFFGATGGFVVAGSSCGYFPAESGDAYAPWNFPNGETRPEWVAARASILAANPHNTQPWALTVSESVIELRSVASRALGSIDSLEREMHIGLGCALENLASAAGASGRRADITLLPDATDPSLIARVALTAMAPTADPLFDAIAKRHTNRGRYSDAAPPAALESGMQALVTEPGVLLHLVTSDADKATFRTNTIAATSAFIADPELSKDSNVWYRHTAAEILEFRDGLTLDATGNGASTRFFGKLVGRPSDATANRYWLDGTTGPETTGSAFCILSSSSANSRAEQLRVGRAYQRLHLWLVSQGMAAQPLNQLAELQDREETQGLAPKFSLVLNALMPVPDRRAQMLFRVGYPLDAAMKSPRRPIEWVTA